MDSRAIIERVVDALLQEDADAVAALYTEDGVVDFPLYPEPARGREMIRASQQRLFDMFSDLSVEVRSVLGGDGICAAEVVVRSTNTGPIETPTGERIPATGKQMQQRDVWVFDVTPEGLISEERHYFDTTDAMRQLGLGA